MKGGGSLTGILPTSRGLWKLWTPCISVNFGPIWLGVSQTNSKIVLKALVFPKTTPSKISNFDLMGIRSTVQLQQKHAMRTNLHLCMIGKMNVLKHLFLSSLLKRAKMPQINAGNILTFIPENAARNLWCRLRSARHPKQKTLIANSPVAWLASLRARSIALGGHIATAHSTPTAAKCARWGDCPPKDHCSYSPTASSQSLWEN